MKNLILALALLFACSISHAQARNGLKGPAAKNYKPWMQPTKAFTPSVAVSDYKNRLKGPSAKNSKPWKKKNKKYHN